MYDYNSAPEENKLKSKHSPTSVDNNKPGTKTKQNIFQHGPKKEEGKGSRPEMQPPFCLNKEICPSERHYIKSCPHSAETTKDRLLQEYRNKKKIGLKKFRQGKEHFSDGRIESLLMDTISVTVSGYYSADHEALSDIHISSLAANDIFVPILPLKEPIVMELAVTGKDEPLVAIAKRKARVSTTLITPQAPLRLQNVE